MLLNNSAKKSSLPILILLNSLLASSAASQQLTCGDVYSNAVVNVEVETTDATTKSFVYNLYCEQSGEMKSFALGGGLSFPLKEMPLELNGKMSWDQTDLKDFCKIGSEENYSHNTQFDFGRYVVENALKSFNECRSLELQGLVISHQVAPPEAFTIHGSFRGVTSKGTLDIVDYDDNLMDCKSSNFSKDGSEEKLLGSMKIPVGSDNFNIVCRRKPISSGDGEYYPSAAFTIATSWGPYTLAIPGDRHFGFELASQAEAAHAAAMNKAAVAELGLGRALDRIRNLGPAYTTQGFVGDSYAHHQPNGLPCGGDIVGHLGGQCPSGTRPFVYSAGSSGGGSCGNSYFSLVCLPNQ